METSTGRWLCSRTVGFFGPRKRKLDDAYLFFDAWNYPDQAAPSRKGAKGTKKRPKRGTGEDSRTDVREVFGNQRVL